MLYLPTISYIIYNYIVSNNNDRILFNFYETRETTCYIIPMSYNEVSQ